MEEGTVLNSGDGNGRMETGNHKDIESRGSCDFKKFLCMWVMVQKKKREKSRLAPWF